MTNTEYKPFCLGKIVATYGVIETVPNSRMLECLDIQMNVD